MIMKKVLLSLALAAVSALPTFADSSSDYVPIVREGVEWGHKAYGKFYAKDTTVYYREQLKGDTIIEGKTYKKCYRYTENKLNTATANLAAFIREENKRVYVYPNIHRNFDHGGFVVKDLSMTKDEKEYLVYDFNLANTGETEVLCDIYKTYVKEVRDTIVGGQSRKIYTLSEKTRSWGEFTKRVVLEGVGSIYDEPFNTGDYIFPYQDQYVGETYWLWSRHITYEKNVGGDIVYKSQYFDENDPALKPGGVNTVADGGARVYGTGGAVVIDGDGVGYVVFTADGRLLLEGSADGRTEIPLAAGLYIVKTSTGTATKVVVR